jgi:hypothetical protein
MERLTKHSKQTSHENGICCTHFFGPECLEVGGNCAMNCKWEEAAWSRLAAYEDTRLTPEEVTTLQKDWNTLCTVIGECGGIERVKELAEADKDGRVVVLPCKDWLNVVFGDQVLFWGIDKSYMENPIREISVDDAERIGWYDGYKTVYLKGTDENGEAWEFCPEEVGKTVFLTREEAEKALEARKDGDKTDL